MKILITGATGLLGNECVNVFSLKHTVIAPSKKEMNITSWDGVIDVFHKQTPEVTLNCAAYTDYISCEYNAEPWISKVNVEGPRNLAQCSARYKSKMIHISSNDIFSGNKIIPQPYFEDDPMDPKTVYGKYKRDSEVAVRENAPYYIIIRSGWLYGIGGSANNNFIKDLIIHSKTKKSEPFTVPFDQFGSPTWAKTLASQIEVILESQGRGTYHATSEGQCSKKEFAELVNDILELDIKFNVVSIKNRSVFKVQSPSNSLIENRNLKQQGINIMPEWQNDVKKFLEQYGDELLKETEAEQ